MQLLLLMRSAATGAIEAGLHIELYDRFDLRRHKVRKGLE